MCHPRPEKRHDPHIAHERGEPGVVFVRCLGYSISMTHDQFRAALKALGLTYHTAATTLKMGKWGYQSVGKWARGEQSIPGGVELEIGLMLEREGIALEEIEV